MTYHYSSEHRTKHIQGEEAKNKYIKCLTLFLGEGPGTKVGP